VYTHSLRRNGAAGSRRSHAYFWERSVKIADLVIAATAEDAGVAVWHYDRDYERIADVTGQPHEWIAPAGSL
jgi:predicted nucleic acid-binding protein